MHPRYLNKIFSNAHSYSLEIYYYKIIPNIKSMEQRTLWLSDNDFKNLAKTTHKFPRRDKRRKITFRLNFRSFGMRPKAFPLEDFVANFT